MSDPTSSSPVPVSPEKLADLRRRAAQQAKHGNYWAGKLLAVLDDRDRLAARVAELDALLDRYLCGCGDELDDAHRPGGKCANCLVADGEPDAPPTANERALLDRIEVLEAGGRRSDLQRRIGDWHRLRFPHAGLIHVALKAAEEVGEVASATLVTEGRNSAKDEGDLTGEAADVVLCLMVLVDRWFPGVDLIDAVEAKLAVLTDPTSRHRAALSALGAAGPAGDPETTPC